MTERITNKLFGKLEEKLYFCNKILFDNPLFYTTMKKFLFTLLTLFTLCSAAMAEDLTENLRFYASYKCEVPIKGGTVLTLSNRARVGHQFDKIVDGNKVADWQNFSDYTSVRVVFKEHVTSNLIKLSFRTPGKDPDNNNNDIYVLSDDINKTLVETEEGYVFTQDISSLNTTVKGTTYTTFDRVCIYYGSGEGKTAVNIQEISMYNGETKVHEYTDFTVLTGTVQPHTLAGDMIATGDWAMITLTNEAMGELSLGREDTQVDTYTFHFEADIPGPMSFRLYHPKIDSDDKNNYVTRSFYPNADTSHSPRLTKNSENDYSISFSVSKENLKNDRTTDCNAVCLAASNWSSLGYPQTVKIKSITRTGREGIRVTRQTTDGWATYTNSKRLDLTRVEALVGYKVTGIRDDGSLILQEVSVVPEATNEEMTPDGLKAVGTPLIMRVADMEESRQTFGVPSTSKVASDVSGNLLQASANDITVNDATDLVYYYCMAKKDGVIGFYRVADGVTIPAFKAYLTEDKSSAAAARVFLSFGDDDNETTDIVPYTQNNSKPSNNDIYDLAGHRVTSPVSGHIYISNGKTFLAK